MDYLAKTLAGLEEILAKELKAIGAQDVEIGNRVVRFSGDKTILYRANLELRTAIRILTPIHRFRVRHENELYKKVQQVDWSQYIGLNDTFAINAVTNSEAITHSHYAALKTKDAIVDQFRNKTGQRPSVDIHSPTLRLNLHIRNDWGTILLDSSGDSLHKRGYRQSTVPAPINEVLAAGMILLADWQADGHFVDAMCGSGTLPIEAALIAYNIPPQVLRQEFGFMRWPDFDAELWKETRKAALARSKDFAYEIWANDKDNDAIQATKANIRAIGFTDKIKVTQGDYSDFEPPVGSGLMMLNPPYDERLERSDINALYKAIGDRLKQSYSGWEAWLISSNMAALKYIGLRPSRKIPLFNGPLECKFHKFELYRGSKKGKWMKEERENEKTGD
ncbi:MAG: THUMP domain-containing protein [Saprospiraceae bacterium]